MRLFACSNLFYLSQKHVFCLFFALKHNYTQGLRPLPPDQVTSLATAAGSAISAALPWVLDGLDMMAPAVPFFAPVFTLLKVVYAATVAMGETRDNAVLFSERLLVLGTTVRATFDKMLPATPMRHESLRTCMRGSAASTTAPDTKAPSAETVTAIAGSNVPSNGSAGGETSGLLDTVARKLRELKALLEDAESFVLAYQSRSKPAKFFLSGKYQDGFADLDTKLTRTVADLGAIISIQVRHELSMHAVYVTDRLDRLEALVNSQETQIRNIEATLASLGEQLRDLVLDGPAISLFLRQHHATILRLNTEVQQALQLYVPLLFGTRRPPLAADDFSTDVDMLLQAVLQLPGAASLASAQCWGEPLAEPGAESTSAPRMIFVQGAAGTGKSLLGWRMMELWDSYWESLSPEAHSSTTMATTATAAPARAAQPRTPIIISCATLSAAALLSWPERERTGEVRDFLLTQLCAAYPRLEDRLREMLDRLDATGINVLYAQPWVFVIDGLDELGDRVRLAPLLRADRWINSTFVVSCRTDFFADDAQARTYLTHAAADAHARIPVGTVVVGRDMTLKSIHLLPFSESQRVTYISNFALKSEESAARGWTAATYHSTLARYPQMNEFLAEPLLLFLVLSILPLLVDKQSAASQTTKSKKAQASARTATTELKDDSLFSVNIPSVPLRLDPEFLEVQPIDALTTVFPRFTRAELYAVFVFYWIQREALRRGHVDDEDPSIPNAEFFDSVHDFCQEFAVELTARGRVQVVIPDTKYLGLRYQSLVRGGKVFGRSHARALRAIQASKDVSLTCLQGRLNEFLCSPLRRQGDSYAFVHRTVQEYFTALAVLRTLGKLKYEQPIALHSPTVYSTTVLAPSTATAAMSAPLPITRAALAAGDGLGVVRFCADMVDVRVQYYVTMLRDAWQATPTATPEATDGSSSTRNPPTSSSADSFSDLPPLSPDAKAMLASRGVTTWEDVAVSSRALWDLVQLSRSVSIDAHSPPTLAPSSSATTAEARLRAATAAANALTILNAAGLVFARCDLSRALLGPPTPLTTASASASASASGTSSSGPSPVFLDLSGGIFSYCDLRGACLNNARLANVQFDGANLTGARLLGVTFGQQPKLLGHDGEVTSLSMSPDGSTLVSGSADGTVRVWDMPSGRLRHALFDHASKVTGVAVLPGGAAFVSTSSDCSLRFYSLPDGSAGSTMQCSSAISAICMVKASSSATTTSTDFLAIAIKSPSLFSNAQILLLDLSTMTPGPVIDLGGSDEASSLAAFGEDVAAVLSNGTSVLWWSKGRYSEPPVKFSRPTQQSAGILNPEALNCLALHPDGEHVVAGSHDRCIFVWNRNNPAPKRVITNAHAGHITALVITADGQQIVSCSSDLSICVTMFKTGQVLFSLRSGSPKGYSALILSPCGRRILTGSHDGAVRINDLSMQGLVRSLAGHNRDITAIAVSHDTRTVVSGAMDGVVRVWDRYACALSATLQQSFDPIRTVALSATGTLLAAGGHDKHIYLWSLPTGTLRHRLVGHTGWVLAVAFFPDGVRLLSGGMHDECARVWSAETGAALVTLAGHPTQGILSVGVHGSTLFTHAMDKANTLRVWDADSAKLLREATSTDDRAAYVSCRPVLFDTGSVVYLSDIRSLGSNQ
jgi:WD40 repeat protein